MNRTGVGVAVLLAIGVVVALLIALWPDADTSLPETPSPTSSAHESAAPVPSATALTGAVIYHPPVVANASPTATPLPVSATDPTSWAKMSRKDFGCMLERDFGFRDHLWNCSSDEPPTGDPCRDVENFYRGPQIPAEFGSKVSPLVDRVELHWEHGNLQEIDVTFRPNVGDREIQQAFALPSTMRIARENVQSSELRELNATQRQLVIKGFERNQDVNCGDGRQPD
ncbi:MAG TPA: hypothetical protein VMV18_11810 [bacterium]|nr:hypothetical protein [bacterium]